MLEIVSDGGVVHTCCRVRYTSTITISDMGNDFKECS